MRGNLPLSAGHCLPAYEITTRHLHPVLCLVGMGAVGLDDPFNGYLRSLRPADDTVTVRELLAHTAASTEGADVDVC